MKLELKLEIGDKVLIRPKEWFDKYCKLVGQGNRRFYFKSGWIKPVEEVVINYTGKTAIVTKVLDNPETIKKYGSTMYEVRVINDEWDSIILTNIYPELLISNNYIDILDKIKEYCENYCINECQDNCPIKLIRS